MWRTFLLVCVFSFQTVGCAPAAQNFYAISLENVSGVQLVEKSRPDIFEFERVKEIWTRYKLTRKNFVLSFEVTNASPHPHVDISSISNSGAILNVVPIKSSLTDERGIICSTFNPVEQKLPQTHRFTWSPSCDTAHVEARISFLVMNQNNQQIGRETLEFQITKIGTYWVLDGV